MEASRSHNLLAHLSLPLCILTTVNTELERRFLEEANSVFDRITSDISDRTGSDGAGHDEAHVSLLTCLESFVTESLLDTLKYVANNCLHQRGLSTACKNEVLGLFILRVLWTSYKKSPSTVCNEAEEGHFFSNGYLLREIP